MIPYGRKTPEAAWRDELKFEGSVIPYGRKTCNVERQFIHKFEGSVIPYGRKTNYYRLVLKE